MRIVVLVSAATLLVAAACSKPTPADGDQAEPVVAGAPSQPAAASSPAAATARHIFATRCTPCHGPQGMGDGPASAGLTPKPRNFGDAAWQQSIDDAYVEKIIKFGGVAVGKSPAMPGNPDLTDPAIVAELRAVVRSFKH